MNLKNIIKSAFALIAFSSCTDLNMNPLEKPANETWYQDKTQVEMSLNTLLLQQFWPMERNEFVEGSAIMDLDEPTDDMVNRNSQNVFKKSTLTGNNSNAVIQMWNYTYKGISRCNTIIDNLSKAQKNLTEEQYQNYLGCARFYRACFYSRIIQLFGDPIYFTSDLTLEEAFTKARTPVKDAIEKVYEDFDFAAEHCPVSYSGSEVQRVTKGAAYAMKARIALHYASICKFSSNSNLEEANKHYQIAAKAAKDCMDLNAYSLYPDYEELFLSKTHNSCESIFCIPRSYEFSDGVKKQYLWGLSVTSGLPRTQGGYCSNNPTLDLFCSYICTDGKTIDQSPLYDPKKPFENRDPRLKASIVEFGSKFCGVVYNPRFDVKTVWSDLKQAEIKNDDNMLVSSDPKLPSRTCLIRKKGIDETWTDDQIADNDKIIMRYADVLLMYAEAKIELGTIDQSVLDVMNQVRARAYKVDINSTDYPHITTTDQLQLRRTIRLERRMEFAFERLRLYDIIRWRIAEKVLNKHEWGFKYNNSAALKQMITLDKWFLAETPVVDEDGCPDLETAFTGSEYMQTIHERVFDKQKNYLWPIPTNDVLVNDNILQNDHY